MNRKFLKIFGILFSFSILTHMQVFATAKKENGLIVKKTIDDPNKQIVKETQNKNLRGIQIRFSIKSCDMSMSDVKLKAIITGIFKGRLESLLNLKTVKFEGLIKEICVNKTAGCEHVVTIKIIIPESFGNSEDLKKSLRSLFNDKEKLKELANAKYFNKEAAIQNLTKAKEKIEKIIEEKKKYIETNNSGASMNDLDNFINNGTLTSSSQSIFPNSSFSPFFGKIFNSFGDIVEDDFFNNFGFNSINHDKIKEASEKEIQKLEGFIKIINKIIKELEDTTELEKTLKDILEKVDSFSVDGQWAEKMQAVSEVIKSKN